MRKTADVNHKVCAEIEKDRVVSLDALRVLCMFFIVLGHAVVHGDVLQYTLTYSLDYFVINVLIAFLSVHVDCFVLISGYFMCTKEFKLRKILTLWGKTLFWSALLYLVLCLNGFLTFSVQGILMACFPFTQQRYWFATSYILMYLMIPTLNSAIRVLKRTQHANCILIFFVVYIVFQNLFFWSRFTYTNEHDPLFFAFLYIVAAYLRKYPATHTRKEYIMFYVAICSFVAIWKIAVGGITETVMGRTAGDTIFLSNNSVTMVVASVCIFRFFEGVNDINELMQRAILFLSPLTFGIYLIHDQPEVRNFLWQIALQPFNFSQSKFLIIYLFGIAIVVFLCCALMEYFRNKMFRILIKDKIIVIAVKKIKEVNAWLLERIFRLKCIESDE